jgi:cytochrome c-type biogenesis protein CcmH/NrfF
VALDAVGSAGVPSSRVRWGRLAWVAVGAALVLALAVGAGAFGGHGPPATLYERALQVAGEYRCPVCADESAAVSDTPAAIEIRDDISTWLKAGWSEARIRTELVHDYGPSILEKPPASGDGVLVWALPALAAALGLGGLGLAFRRWRRTEPEAAQASAVPGGLAAARGGPVDGDPLREVVAAAGGPSGPAPAASSAPRRRFRQLTTLGGATLVVLAGALWLLDRESAPRATGQTATGGVTGITNELVEAAALAPKDPLSALVIYQEVLRSDPRQPVALAAEGWIYAQGGYATEGLSLLSEAEAADPSYPPPHLYRGLVLLDQDRHPAAAAELHWYLTHHPAASELKVARAALVRAEEPGAGHGHAGG